MSPCRFDVQASVQSSTQVDLQASTVTHSVTPSITYSASRLVFEFGRLAHAVGAVFQGLSASLEARGEGVRQYFEQFLTHLTCCVSDEAEPDCVPADSTSVERASAEIPLDIKPELVWLKETRFVSGSVVTMTSLPTRCRTFRRADGSTINSWSEPMPTPKLLDFLTLENGERGWINKLEQAVKDPTLHHTIHTPVAAQDGSTGQDTSSVMKWSGVHVGNNYLLMDLTPLTMQERARFNLNRLDSRAQCVRAKVFSPVRKATFEVIFRELSAPSKINSQGTGGRAGSNAST